MLEGFTLVRREASDATANRARVVDAAGRVLWDSGAMTLKPGMFIAMDCEPIRSALPLRIEVQSFARLGLEALIFSQWPHSRETAVATPTVAGASR